MHLWREWSVHHRSIHVFCIINACKTNKHIYSIYDIHSRIYAFIYVDLFVRCSHQLFVKYMIKCVSNVPSLQSPNLLLSEEVTKVGDGTFTVKWEDPDGGPEESEVEAKELEWCGGMKDCEGMGYLGSTHNPGCQWQMKVYRNPLLKM